MNDNNSLKHAEKEELFRNVTVFDKNYLEGVFLFLKEISENPGTGYTEPEGEGEGEHIILTFDSGWYAVCRNIKEELEKKYKVTCFCLSEGGPYGKSLKKLLSSVKKPLSLMVAGDENLALTAAGILVNVPICFIALNFDFCHILKKMVWHENCRDMLIADPEILLRAGKNKVYAAAKSVVSKNILLVENAAFEAVYDRGGNGTAGREVRAGQADLNKFLSSHDISLLISAQVHCGLALAYSDAGYMPGALSYALFKQGNFCEKGESEYLAYKMLVRIYRLYLSEKPGYLIRKGDILGGIARAEEILSPFENMKCGGFYYTDAEISDIRDKILKNGGILKSLDDFAGNFAKDKEKFGTLYAGKKYTVENYSKKQRIYALKTAPFLTESFSLLKVIYADGFLEYIE